jgi:hypothetical protein
VITRRADAQPDCDWFRYWPLALILGVQWSCLLWHAYRSSPVNDEFGHFYAGLAYHKFDNQELFCVNPPLVRAIGSWPGSHSALESQVTVPDLENIVRPEFFYGRVLFGESPILFQRSLFFGRALVSLFAILVTILCYLWAKRLGGQVAAVVVATLWAFQPQVIAHGSFITNDVPVASMMLMAMYLYSDWLRRPSIRRTFFCGLILGTALLCKFTAVLLLPIFVIGFALTIQRPLSKSALRFGLLLGIAWFVLCAGYGFRGFGTKLGDYGFVSQMLSDPMCEVDRLRSNRFHNTWLADLPIPLPKYFLLGVDLQQLDFDKGLDSYALGTHKIGSWWWFFGFSMLVKLPVGTLVAMGWANLQWLPRIRHLTPDEWLVIGMAFLIFETTAIKSGIGQQVRYILPLYPYLLILLAPALRNFQWLSRKGMIAAACCIVTMIESAWVAPYWTSSFNFLAGGTQCGYRYLYNDATDWGQSLYDIVDWVKKNPEKRPLTIISRNSTFGVEEYTAVLFPDDVEIQQEVSGDGWVLISQHDRAYSQWDPINERESFELVAGSHLVYFIEGSGKTSVHQDSSP